MRLPECRRGDHRFRPSGAGDHPRLPDEIDTYLREALVRAGREDAAERAAELSVLLAGGIAACVAQHAVDPALAARDAAIRLLDGPERTIQTGD